VAKHVSSRGLDIAAWREAGGLYHLTAAGRTSWHGFANAILTDKIGMAKVSPIPTSAYPTPANRPRNSVLDNGKLRERFGIKLPDWKTGLGHCLEELQSPSGSH
jgi:dTDP-4-dehydrorhamnose reductase